MEEGEVVESAQLSSSFRVPQLPFAQQLSAARPSPVLASDPPPVMAPLRVRSPDPEACAIAPASSSGSKQAKKRRNKALKAAARRAEEAGEPSTSMDPGPEWPSKTGQPPEPLAGAVLADSLNGLAAYLDLSPEKKRKRSDDVLVPFYQKTFKSLFGREPGQVLSTVEVGSSSDPPSPLSSPKANHYDHYPILGIRTEGCLSSRSGLDSVAVATLAGRVAVVSAVASLGESCELRRRLEDVGVVKYGSGLAAEAALLGSRLGVRLASWVDLDRFGAVWARLLETTPPLDVSADVLPGLFGTKSDPFRGTQWPRPQDVSQAHVALMAYRAQLSVDLAAMLHLSQSHSRDPRDWVDAMGAMDADKQALARERIAIFNFLATSGMEMRPASDVRWSEEELWMQPGASGLWTPPSLSSRANRRMGRHPLIDLRHSLSRLRESWLGSSQRLRALFTPLDRLRSGYHVARRAAAEEPSHMPPFVIRFFEPHIRETLEITNDQSSEISMRLRIEEDWELFVGECSVRSSVPASDLESELGMKAFREHLRNTLIYNWAKNMVLAARVLSACPPSAACVLGSPEAALNAARLFDQTQVNDADQYRRVALLKACRSLHDALPIYCRTYTRIGGQLAFPEMDWSRPDTFDIVNPPKGSAAPSLVSTLLKALRLALKSEGLHRSPFAPSLSRRLIDEPGASVRFVLKPAPPRDNSRLLCGTSSDTPTDRMPKLPPEWAESIIMPAGTPRYRRLIAEEAAARKHLTPNERTQIDWLESKVRIVKSLPCGEQLLNISDSELELEEGEFLSSPPPLKFLQGLRGNSSVGGRSQEPIRARAQPPPSVDAAVPLSGMPEHGSSFGGSREVPKAVAVAGPAPGSSFGGSQDDIQLRVLQLEEQNARLAEKLAAIGEQEQLRKQGERKLAQDTARVALERRWADTAAETRLPPPSPPPEKETVTEARRLLGLLAAKPKPAEETAPQPPRSADDIIADVARTMRGTTATVPQAKPTPIQPFSSKAIMNIRGQKQSTEPGPISQQSLPTPTGTSSKRLDAENCMGPGWAEILGLPSSPPVLSDPEGLARALLKEVGFCRRLDSFFFHTDAVGCLSLARVPLRLLEEGKLALRLHLADPTAEQMWELLECGRGLRGKAQFPGLSIRPAVNAAIRKRLVNEVSARRVLGEEGLRIDWVACRVWAPPPRLPSDEELAATLHQLKAAGLHLGRKPAEPKPPEFFLEFVDVPGLSSSGNPDLTPNDQLLLDRLKSALSSPAALKDAAASTRLSRSLHRPILRLAVQSREEVRAVLNEVRFVRLFHAREKERFGVPGNFVDVMVIPSCLDKETPKDYFPVDFGGVLSQPPPQPPPTFLQLPPPPPPPPESFRALPTYQPPPPPCPPSLSTPAQLMSPPPSLGPKPLFPPLSPAAPALITLGQGSRHPASAPRCSHGFWEDCAPCRVAFVVRGAALLPAPEAAVLEKELSRRTAGGEEGLRIDWTARRIVAAPKRPGTANTHQTQAKYLKKS